MHNRARIVVVAAAMVVMTSQAALAGDLCITSGSNVLFAGRKFTLPGKDKCKPITGFNHDDLCSGVACTAKDGSEVRVHYTCSEDQIIVLKSFYYAFPLPLPSSNAGLATYAAIDNGTVQGSSSPPGTYQLAACEKPLLIFP
jgi:hypothetical protein